MDLGFPQPVCAGKAITHATGGNEIVTVSEAIAELKHLVSQNGQRPEKIVTRVQWSDVGDAVAGLTAWEIRRANAARATVWVARAQRYLQRVMLLQDSGTAGGVPAPG